MQGSGFKKALRVEALGSADMGTSAEKKSNMIVVGLLHWGPGGLYNLIT